ncbi:hypothetical protein [Amycolatopsis sp. NPDC004625]|uniref:hypothetical protein n=1 Tax=Amycolatopsis sp. NPDC004625 TaxID=3154670 RepID=UPI0033B6325D
MPTQPHAEALQVNIRIDLPGRAADAAVVAARARIPVPITTVRGVGYRFESSAPVALA